MLGSPALPHSAAVQGRAGMAQRGHAALEKAQPASLQLRQLVSAVLFEGVGVKMVVAALRCCEREGCDVIRPLRSAIQY